MLLQQQQDDDYDEDGAAMSVHARGSDTGRRKYSLLGGFTCYSDSYLIFAAEDMGRTVDVEHECVVETVVLI